MYKKLKRILSMMLLATFALSYSAFAVDTDIQPYASIYLTHKEASLASSNNQLAVNFSVVSNISVAKIGVSSITLHDVTSGTTKNFSGLTVSGKENAGRKILGAGVSGHQYYATVVLCALNSNGSGATYTVTTNYVTV